MVKPNQYDVGQDRQEKERYIDVENPTIDVLMDFGKIFRSDKLPRRIVGDAVNCSATKRVNREEKKRIVRSSRISMI